MSGPRFWSFPCGGKTESDMSKQRLVSNLTELTMSGFSDADDRISKHFTKLTVLNLYILSSRDLLRLSDALSQGKLPNLSALSVAKSPLTDPTFVDEFDLQQARKLEKLKLRGFIVSSRKLKLLCQKPFFLQLREFNFSYSRSMPDNLSVLFTHSFP